MGDTLNIIKIGGNVLDDSLLLEAFLKDITQMNGPRILVHGGGKLATEYLNRLGIQPVMKDGRRITDAATLEVVTMVYAGLLNKRIVSGLQALGTNSLGLSGADLNLIIAHQRAVGETDYGFAGDIDQVNVNTLKGLLIEGILPVICSITHDGQGQLLNTNADTIASAIATSLAGSFPVQIIYCFEIPGVIKDHRTGETFEMIDQRIFAEAMKSGILSGGILPKLSNAFEALDQGVEEVVICHSKDLSHLGTRHFKGTRIVK